MNISGRRSALFSPLSRVCSHTRSELHERFIVLHGSEIHKHSRDKGYFLLSCLIGAICRLKFTLHLVRRLFSVCEHELEDLRMWSTSGPLAHAHYRPAPT